VAPPGVASDYEERLRAGGLGYGDLKKALFEQYWNYFVGIRAKRAELEKNLDDVHQVLDDGAVKARTLAQKVVQRAKIAAGLD
jgi:tryptophanyl-tRNA synthetase